MNPNFLINLIVNSCIVMTCVLSAQASAANSQAIHPLEESTVVTHFRHSILGYQMKCDVFFRNDLEATRSHTSLKMDIQAWERNWNELLNGIQFLVNDIMPHFRSSKRDSLASHLLEELRKQRECCLKTPKDRECAQQKISNFLVFLCFVMVDNIRMEQPSLAETKPIPTPPHEAA